jgi:hypothetical protein
MLTRVGLILVMKSGGDNTYNQNVKKHLAPKWKEEVTEGKSKHPAIQNTRTKSTTPDATAG